MFKQEILRTVDRQEWLDTIAERLQPAVLQLFKSAGEAGLEIKDALHGVWLGHPLHPVVTDIPIGAWTAALFLDAVDATRGAKANGRGADLAVAVGLAGAIASAVTGITEWSETSGRSRRIGTLHGMLNTLAASFYAASLGCRLRGDRSRGRRLATTGYLISMAAAYFGGTLVFSEKVGVDHTAGITLPKEWTAVLRDEELAEKTLTKVDANGAPVLLVRIDGEVQAIVERCSHLGGPLSEGTLDGCTVKCPWHGSEFCTRDGKVERGPSTHAQPRLEARLRDGIIEVRAG